MTTASAAQEDYLETILGLIESKGVARVRDIASAMAVHKSTVSAALHALGRKGLLNYSPYELATLTADGMSLARRVSGHHAELRRFLTDALLLDARVAEENACRMEHVVDREVIDRLVLLSQFMARNGRLARGGFRRFAGRLRRAPRKGGEA